ncbi:GerAB/ArcD/ProY family transporter [Paenibacillus sp. Soil787]|uniref:GerAB/ArcD/ProY family transporter n=1 Tax=Paenibacillus sp. Soil787 TaxID=1736411 RepID=UPI0006F54B9B|nr:endospore germination permease [Paenibacillus sp. Soil787]KRF43654.1 spore gernimation protein [Paenibacillus sp. Soil787]
MKKYACNEVTFMQYIFLIHGTQVGAGIANLPRLLAEKAGTDGWISIIINWAISVVASLLIIQIMKRCPNGSLLELFQQYFGRPAARVLAVIVAAGFGFTAITIMVRTMLVIKSWILPLTPDYIVLTLFAIPTYLAVRGGVRILGRYAELVFFLLIGMLLFYLLALSENHYFLHLLPLFKKGWEPVLSASSSTISSFMGFETAFMLYPYLQKKQAASSGIVIANTLTMIVFLYITLTCFVFFSPDEITQYNEPTVNLLKVLEFRFAARLEILFLAFYLFIISTTWMPYLFWSLFCMSWLLGKKDYSRALLVLLLLFIAYTFFYIPTFNQVEHWLKLIGQFGRVFGFLFPLCLWIYVCIRDRLKMR